MKMGGPYAETKPVLREFRTHFLLGEQLTANCPKLV
jgi:hypothetical protein